MLSTLLWLPLVGAAIVGFIPGNLEGAKLRQITSIFALIIFGWSIWLLTQFDLSVTGLQFQEYLPWLPKIGLSYSLGIDGISLPLIVLNTLLTGIAIYSIGEKLERSRLYYALILIINAGISGALMAQNLLLFIIFYELELIPFYLMIAIWGGEKRGYASIKFLLYTAISGLLVLAAFLGITFLSGGTSFDYVAVHPENFGLNTQLILLTLILVGFGIKIPLVPLHTWLPDAYTEASPATAILLGGILAKLGTYGLIRFGLQLFPETWAIISPGLAIIGTISVIYGALSAIAQKDIKRMVAYSSIGHMGYILVAAAAGTDLSILGSVAQMISHGLILALLFHLVGIVERKVGTRDLDILNGLMNPIRGLPLTSALLITAGMASAGIPGLVGFAAEFMVFQGSFSSFPIPTLLCIIASGLTAVYFVILLNRTCFGKLDNKHAYYPKALPTETIPALVLTAIILFLGIQPNWLVRWIEPTTDLLARSNITSPKIEQIAIK
ncbi:NADH-quinone oxidoreductase subunit M [Gloeothece verrucosa]|uniref:Proton-translocating NADH-quinone oxidoreductase, chain M n=1 Tax=Gloeothece verrucosa (strain PCC 7822) TaxID=497965 RepID=E0UIW0_GLOV7|nr:NADH-quinone oxidoreductase subunit M [Gloeothece verrucosa]ADN13419.1 proton-translocating NADH-quinone oxidoreductase, chain M [Gloeothece verrucosa PCC 7822]